MVLFNDYLKELSHTHDDSIVNISDAYRKLSDYDLVSYNSHIMLRPGDTPFIIRDFIDNICNFSNVFIVVNNVEVPITDDTKILPFLTPLNVIILRNKNDIDVVITFRKFVMTVDLSDKLLYKLVDDSNFEYYYGCIHNKSKSNTLDLRTDLTT
jgi:hypothetical protein